MKRAYQVFAFLLAAEVVIQAMAIAYALAGLGHWIDDGNTLTKQLIDDEDLHFQGVGGFAIHGINGMMIIPLVALLFLLVSLFSKIPGGTKKAGGLFLLVILQVVLGTALHDAVAVAPLHALNGFLIFSGAVMTGVWAGKQRAGAEGAI